MRTRAAIAALAVALTARTAHAGLDRSIERTMDRQARDAIESQYRVVADARLQTLVDRLGQAVAAQTGRKDVQFQFKILDTPEVNAVALPAGHIYVTTGLIEFADGPDEIANVLAHEAVHVARKHSLQDFKRGFWTTVLTSFLRLPSGTAQAVNLAVGLRGLRYSRQDEGEADRLGAKYAHAAGFDPRFMKLFMDKLGKKERISTVESYLSTHPTSKRRSDRLTELPELDVKNAANLAAIAAGYSARHMPNMAILRLRQAAAIAPQDARVRRLLAESYYQAGDPEAAAREIEVLKRLSPGEKAPASPVPGSCGEEIPPNLAEKAQDAKKRVDQALIHTQPADDLKRIAAEMDKSGKDLRKKYESMAQDVAQSQDRSGGATPDARRAQAVLLQVRDGLAAVEAVRKGLDRESGDAAATGRALAASLDSERDACARARLVRAAEQFVAAAERAGNLRNQAIEGARKAISSANTALQHLQGAGFEGYRPAWMSSASSAAAAGELRAAEGDGGKAAQEAAAAKEAQGRLDSMRTLVSVDIETAAAPAAQLAAYDSLVAWLLGVPEQEVAAARRREGGVGGGLGALVKQMPAREKPAAAKPGEVRPAEPGSKDADRPEAGKPARADGERLVVEAAAKAVRLEAAAGREWRSATGGEEKAKEGVLP